MSSKRTPSMSAKPASNTLLLSMPGNEITAEALGALLGFASMPITVHTFPDGESLVTLPEGIADYNVVLVCTLDQPNAKLAPLLFAADAARQLGAKRVGLIAPYLAYMRQDMRFHSGEAISSRTFAATLSRYLDFLLTVDPHLHRVHMLGEIYAIPSRVITAAPAIVGWLHCHVTNPLLIGPDVESEQWTAAVAEGLSAPYVVLEKIRRGDSDVSVSLPDTRDLLDRTPVLLDDILSTGRTMIAAVTRIRESGLPAPICVCVHAVMAGDAYQALLAAGAAEVVSCNTISHASNAIDITPLLAQGLLPFCQ